MKSYAKSYKDLKLNASQVVEGGKRGISALAIVAILLPFLVPVGVQAQTSDLEDTTEAVEQEVGEVVDETTGETEEQTDSQPSLRLVEGDEIVVPSGTVQITKYNCPEGLEFDNTLASPAKPNSSGVAVIPAGCVPAAGYSFGWIHEPGKTDNSAPFIGRDTADAFTAAPGVTNALGVLVINGLANGGRHDLTELDGGVAVSDSKVYGFMCMEDTGTKSDNYDVVFNAPDKISYCNVYNKIEKPNNLVIEGDKVVCLTEADLPNWGDPGAQVGEPAMITGTTAADYVAASNGRCHLQGNWGFQYGFAEKDNTSGVHKLPGGHLGQADGTSTLGACHPTYCGNNTFTGFGYADWKDFDSTTLAAGTISAKVNVEDLEGAPGIWVRENLKDGYVPFSYPPVEVPGSDVSAELYCHDDIQNYDNYDEIMYPALGNTYNCVAFNALEGSIIEGDKVVCLTEADLPNWGEAGVQAGEPGLITATTAADYVAASNGQCWLQEGWSFQYGFSQNGDTTGVHKLYGNHIGEADGTSTAGECDPEFCGANTATGTGYGDWKTFDTATSGGGVISASVTVTDLEDAPGIWVRENLQKGYVPFTYPPDGAPGSNVSAEIYCHDDIQNYDNYDQIVDPQLGETYNCVAFNAIEGTIIKAAKIVCLHESDLPNWGEVGLQTGEPAMITSSTAEDYVENSDQQCWLEEDWSFQYGFAEKDNTSGVHKLMGNHIGQADGTSTLGECHPTYCGNNTFTGTGYADWKNFDTSTSANGVISAAVNIADLEGAPGVWVRENLQEGYVPFSYPPDDSPGSNVSAELYCHDDIQNYDNYDEVLYPAVGETYYCVAFNAIEEDDGGECEVDCGGNVLGSISGHVFYDSDEDGVWDEGEEELSNWRAYIDEDGDNTLDGDELYDDTASPYLIGNLTAGTYIVRLVLQNDYVQTTPADEHSVDVAVGENETDWDFGVFNDSQGGCVSNCVTTTSSGGGGGGGLPLPDGSVLNLTTAPVVDNTATGGQPDGQILGASTTAQPEGRILPRTGMAVTWLMIITALGLTPIFKRKEQASDSNA